MVTERVTIKESHGWKKPTDVTVTARDETADTSALLKIKNLTWEKDYLTADDDPVLAALWDNEADAIYDDI